MTIPDTLQAESIRQRQATCKHAFINAHGRHQCVHCGLLHKDWIAMGGKP